jgi:hypothetical protein
MKQKQKFNKSKNKKLIYNYIIQEIDDYNYEQQIINRINYCPYECCDGFLPVIIIDYIPNDLMCYVISKIN